jgi:hypothetical protein
MTDVALNRKSLHVSCLAGIVGCESDKKKKALSIGGESASVISFRRRAKKSYRPVVGPK